MTSEEWIERLSAAARTGEPLDLAGSGPVDPADARSWGADRCIPASALRSVLTCDQTVDPRGLQISGARFPAGLDLAHIVFPHPLHLTQCAFDGPAYLGGIALKELYLNGTHTQDVYLDDAQITCGVFADGLVVHGTIRAVGATIAGQLSICNAKLHNADGEALNLDNAQLTGGVFANDLLAYGTVSALGAKINGGLNLNNAELHKATAEALTIGMAEINGGIFANGLDTHGGVSAAMIHVGMDVELTGAKLRRAEHAKPVLDGAGDVIVGGLALTLRGAKIQGDVLAQGLEADGELRAKGAELGGSLNLREAKLRNPNPKGNALNLESASIKRLVLRLQRVDVQGQIRLYRTVITDLETDADPPGPLVATGWEVKDIYGPLRSDWAAARGWLATTNETSAQPWHTLAAVYERNGDPAGGRILRVAAANKVTKQSPLLTRLFRSVYGLVVGYGYHPLWAGFWLIAIVLAGATIVATHRSDFAPTHDAANSAAIAYLHQTNNPIPAQTPIKPVHYVLSTLLPTALGNTSSDWAVNATWLSVVLTSLKLIAWLLTVLLLAGVTGLLRRA